jgi:hypothetical protein
MQADMILLASSCHNTTNVVTHAANSCLQQAAVAMRHRSCCCAHIQLQENQETAQEHTNKAA